MARNFTVRINSVDKIEQLLQETYDEVCKQYNEIQNEINKLTNSCSLAEVTMDEKSKYSKSIHDLIGDKQKTIQQKLDIAKFMGELVKHNGDVDKTLSDPTLSRRTGLHIDQLKRDLKDIVEQPSAQSYELKKNR